MSRRLEQQTTRVTLRGIVGDYFASWYIMRHFQSPSYHISTSSQNSENDVHGVDNNGHPGA